MADRRAGKGGDLHDAAPVRVVIDGHPPPLYASRPLGTRAIGAIHSSATRMCYRSHAAAEQHWPSAARICPCGPPRWYPSGYCATRIRCASLGVGRNGRFAMQDSGYFTALHAGWAMGNRHAREHARMAGGMLVEPALGTVAELAWRFEGRLPTSSRGEMRGFIRGFVEGYRSSMPRPCRPTSGSPAL